MEVAQKRKTEKCKDGRSKISLSNILQYLQFPCVRRATLFVNTTQSLTQKFEIEMVQGSVMHRQRLPPSFDAVTTRRGTQEVRLSDRVANYERNEAGCNFASTKLTANFRRYRGKFQCQRTDGNILRLIRREF